MGAIKHAPPQVSVKRIYFPLLPTSPNKRHCSTYTSSSYHPSHSHGDQSFQPSWPLEFVSANKYYRNAHWFGTPSSPAGCRGKNVRGYITAKGLYTQTIDYHAADDFNMATTSPLTSLQRTDPCRVGLHGHIPLQIWWEIAGFCVFDITPRCVWLIPDNAGREHHGHSANWFEQSADAREEHRYIHCCTSFGCSGRSGWIGLSQSRFIYLNYLPLSLCHFICIARTM